ncbi:MAG: hypothetical protein AAFQ58_08260 [Pseudomonadota bacterium]
MMGSPKSHSPQPSETRAPRQRSNTSGGFMRKMSGAAIGFLAFSAGVSVPVIGVIAFFAVDGMSDHTLSKSSGQSISTISEATAADERSVIAQQETSDLRVRLAEQTMTQTSAYLAGDQFLCLGESLLGGLLSLSANPQERSAGMALQQSCASRTKRGGDILRGQVEKSLRVYTGH